MSTTRILALVAAMTLMVGAFAAPAMAQPDDRPDRRDRDERPTPEERREESQERREQARERAAEARERRAAMCAQQDNATADENETEDQCAPGHAHAPAFKARREAHAVMGAIRAVEHKIAKLEILELRIRSDNSTENATEKLARIDALQQRLAERLVMMHERVDRLHGKWAEVRDHVEEKRRKGDFPPLFSCDDRHDFRTELIDGWYEDMIARAEARRDHQLAQDNLTAEEEAEIQEAYDRMVARLDTAYEQREAEADAAYEECQAREAEEEPEQPATDAEQEEEPQEDEQEA